MNVEICKRLKDERKRQNLTQQQLADIGGVTATTMFNYENGREPSSGFLAAIADTGIDVLYILTGQRSGSPLLSLEQQCAGFSVEVMSKQEQALLDNYRHSPPEAQAAIKATSAALAQRGVHPQGVGRGYTADKSATATLKKGKVA